MINRKILFMMMLSLAMFAAGSSLYSADHVEAPLAIDNPDRDITDVYAFLDPQDETQIVVAMAVNPFLPPEDDETGFSTDVLYQFKFDNDGDGVEDYVVQVQFDGSGSDQTLNVFAGNTSTDTNTPVSMNPVATGSTQEIITSSDFRVFAGYSDDAFVFDFGQFSAILAGTQDLFRGVTSPILGELSGRNAGEQVDLFAGTNATHIVVSFPKSIVDNGTGFFNGLAGTNVVGIWATASANAVQQERMGQPVINTVFIPQGMKDAFNQSTPADDATILTPLIPDALTQVDTDGTGNTINGRIAVLQLSGLTDLPNGAPLLLPEDFVHPLDDVVGSSLLTVALSPDVLRLDLNFDADDQAIGLFGITNGRRPQDDVIDVALQLLRQLADVKFPDGAMVPVGEDMIPVPGSGPLGSRVALGCTQLPDCEDRRIKVVLQGTDFTTPDSQIDSLDYTTSGNDREFAASSEMARFIPEESSPDFSDTEFPFMASAQVNPDDNDSGGCSLASAGNNEMLSLSALFPILIIGFIGLRRICRRKRRL